MKKYIFILILIATGTYIKAQDNKIEYRKDVLSNGLRVIYNVDRTAPIVSTVLHYEVGSKDEKVGQTGYAHFFEHLMFESAGKIKRGDIPKLINESGGWLNAHTSFDETVYKFKISANEINLPLWIEAQRMRNLSIEEIGVSTQKGVVLEEKNQRVDNQPYGIMLETMLKSLYSDGAYSWATIGSAEDIKNAKISDFQSFYDNFYQPSNAILVISGNFIFQDLKADIEKYFGWIPKKDSIIRNPFKISPLSKEIRKDIIDEKAPHKAVFIGFRGPKIGSDDYYAMNLLSNVLSAGESSRLYKKLVDKEEIAVQTAMMPLNLELDGAILFYGVAYPKSDLSDIEKSIYKEIEKIASEGISKRELEKVKNINEMEILQSRKSTLQKAMLLARYEAYYDNPGLINSEIENYNKVSVDDIKNVAKKYLTTKNRVVLNFYPKEK